MTHERFRSLFHFTPAANWINDPNGLVYYDGEYHLFYQYHPDSTVWGPMHWGHAVSRDLVNWTHLPVALYPDELGTIFSGSAVIDWHNTAGFGPEAMIAIYTYHKDRQGQSQAIAYSLDKGRTWTKYGGNPVIPTPKNLRNFRDPKVFWYGSQDDGHWVMSLAAGNAILFYTSPDLIEWDPTGGFGFGHGSTAGVWETPDLFRLPVEGTDESRWVLLVGLSHGAPAGGSGVQYFIGSFDGHTFTSENPKSTTLWVDSGADAYASQSWSDVPDGRRLMISWMNNWDYGRVIPTEGWRGAMTVPRELTLARTPAGIRLRQQPVAELAALRTQTDQWKQVTVSTETGFQPNSAVGSLWEVQAEFDLAGMAAQKFGVRLGFGHAGEEQGTVTVGYAPSDGQLFVDRTKSGVVDFHPSFPAVHTAEYAPRGDTLSLHLFMDHSSVELFVDDGNLSMTERIFPPVGPVQVELFADGESVQAQELTVHQLCPVQFCRES